MSNYATLKAAVANVIKTNGNKEITGALLQTSLLTMIESLGAHYQFAGIATPGTTPGTPDQNVFYLAFAPGVYSNFGSTVVPYGYVGIFKYNGTWTYQIMAVGALENTPVTITNKIEFPEFGYYRASNGEFVTTDGNKLTDFIPVVEGWGILVNISPSDESTNTITAFDSSFNVVLASCVSGNLVNYKYTVPSGVKYLRFGTRAGSAYLSAASVNFPISNDAMRKLIDITMNGLLTLLTNKLDFSIFGYYRWDNQRFVDDTTGDKVTDFIPVKPGWDILVNISPNDNVTNTITAFDENFNVLWENCVHGNLVNYHYIVPAGVAYLRFGTRSGAAYLEQAQVVFPISISSSVNASDLVMDLPVSDGSDIQSGYAYIDSTTYYIKVKQ